MKFHFTGVNTNKLHDELIAAGIMPQLVLSKDGVTWITVEDSQVEAVNAVVAVHNPGPNLDDIRKAKYYEVTAAYEAELNGTFTSNATGTELEYDYGIESQSRWKKLIDAVAAGFILDTMFPFPITIANGTMVPHTKQQLLQLGAEMVNRELWLYGKWQLMVNADGDIRRATSAEELQAIHW